MLPRHHACELKSFHLKSCAHHEGKKWHIIFFLAAFRLIGSKNVLKSATNVNCALWRPQMVTESIGRKRQTEKEGRREDGGGRKEKMALDW